MITKEEFIKFIDQFNSFVQGIERLENAIKGSGGYCELFETDWFINVGEMYDTFLESHFTESGIDLINWWKFEDVDKIIYQKVDRDLFNGKSEIEYNVNEIDNLWKYMMTYKKDYFKNAE